MAIPEGAVKLPTDVCFSDVGLTDAIHYLLKVVHIGPTVDPWNLRLYIDTRDIIAASKAVELINNLVDNITIFELLVDLDIHNNGFCVELEFSTAAVYSTGPRNGPVYCRVSHGHPPC